MDTKRVGSRAKNFALRIGLFSMINGMSANGYFFTPSKCSPLVMLPAGLGMTRNILKGSGLKR
jgi:hypothetical protein